MNFLILIFILIQLITGDKVAYKFPEEFKFGAATSSFTVEGGWNADGKGESIWDYLVHYKPQFLTTNPGGNLTTQAETAADSYHKFQEDVRVAKEMGLDFYRFSISWTRLCPYGFTNQVLPAGVNYYNRLIDALIAANITPVVVILHSDSPSTGDLFLGGFSNDIGIRAFASYADLVFRLFGDRVRHWITMNSPYNYCKSIFGEIIGLNYEYFPRGHYEYLCGHTALRAHAKAYRLYQTKYKKSQNGTISIALTLNWYEPASQSPADIEAAQRAMDFSFGWFAYPLIFGNYPPRMINTIAKISKKQNYTSSRLLQFTDDEIEEIKGSIDYLSVLFMRTYLVSDNSTVPSSPSAASDVQVATTVPDEWKDPNNLFENPSWSIRKAIQYISKNYWSSEIGILGLSYGAFNDSLNDTFRIHAIKEYLEQILILINEDGIKITSFALWSLIDTYLFYYGYLASYGLVQVDHNNPDRPRIPKASAEYYKIVITNRTI